MLPALLLQRSVFFRITMLLIIFFLLSSGITNSQSLIKTFGKYIPAKYLTDANSNQFESLLDSKSHIHPDLIYYYLNYYNMLSKINSDSSSHQRELYKSYITTKEESYLAERNLWINKQVTSLNNMNIDAGIKSSVTSSFNKIKTVDKNITLSVKENYQEDQNRIEYFTVLFYCGETYPDYSPLDDYSVIADSLEVSHRQKIYAASEAKELSVSEMTQLILDHWYLFSSDENEPILILTNQMTEKYTLKNKPLFSLGFGYSPYNTSLKITPTISISPMEHEIDTKESFPTHSFYATIGYKHYLKEILSPFSYIKVQLFTSLNQSLEQFSISPGYNKKYTYEEIDYYEDVTFKKFRITPITSQSYFLTLSTPVLVFFNSFNVELGLYAGFSKIEYKTEYNYTAALQQGYYDNEKRYILSAPSYHTSGRSAEEIEEIFSYSPTLDISYELMNSLNSSISANFHFFSVYLTYQF